MEKILITIFIFISFAATAQIDTTGTIDSSYILSNNNFNLQIQKPQDVKFWVNRRDVTEVIIIKPNGDFYYKPSAFCDCVKCKRFKGMKKLINP